MNSTDETARGNILVVDDTPANLHLLAQLITQQGYKARALPRGQMVQSAVEVEPPDLILLDINMPEMNGFEVCKQLKANPASRDIPIIFISALDNVQDKIKAFTAGGVDYITKPFKHEEVIARVDTHLTLRRLQRTLESQNLQLQQTTSQLQAITDALTQFLQTNRRSEASGLLLDCALEQTQSRFGFIGMVVNREDAQSSQVSILALRGQLDAATDERAFPHTLVQDMANSGHSKQSLASLETQVGPVVSRARAVLKERGRQAAANTSCIQPPFLGAPVIQTDKVVGFLVVAGRDGDYNDREHSRLGRLTQTAGVLFEYERMKQSQAESERRRQHAEEHVRYLEDTLKSEHNFDAIIGQSPALRQVLVQVERVAKTDSTVLIHGETGTGKEIIARAIHERSPRQDRPLIKINCAALPENLIESELFGHEKGAFTGAAGQRKGRFELADGGTLFLDEIGDMPLAAQVKLLRVLQEQEFERVGGNKPIRVDVRVLAATHRDLKMMAADNEFREDLYYRLNVFPIEMPPLRERREDIVPLMEFFVKHLAAKLGIRVTGIADASLELLQAYDWPGNIRELQNVVERAMILSSDEVLHITPVSLPIDARKTTSRMFAEPSPEPAPITLTDMNATLEEVERRHIQLVLDETHWVIDGKRGAAVILGLHASTLRSRMRKLGIRKPDLLGE